MIKYIMKINAVKIRDKLILIAEVDGHAIWVEGFRFLNGTVSPKNAGVN